MGRGHVEIIHASDVEAEELGAWWPPGARIKVLSRDAETGALTGVVSLPAGYRRGAGSIPHGSELFVLSGVLRIGAAVRTRGFYEYAPASSTQDAWSVEEPVDLLLRAGGAPAFVPGPGDGDASGRIALETGRLQWARGSVPGPPPGLFSKVLRHDEETGERVFLCACVRHYDYPLIEYHDCHEEAYQVSGEMRLGNSGLMRPGSYFWRPPYVSHGPFSSRNGMVAFMTVDGPLVNHYVDDPRRTVEENRAEALAQGPPRDYFAESKAGSTAM